MITDEQLNDFISRLMGEIAEDEKSLDRKRIRLDVLLDLRKSSSREVPQIAQADRTEFEQNGRTSGYSYAGLPPSAAIIEYLHENHGAAQMAHMLDALADQVETKSSKPRNVVRTCAKQLAERNKVRIVGGEITLVDRQ